MVRGHPPLLALVPLEHWKIRDPEETVILRRISGFPEDAVAIGVLLSQGKPQQPGGSINRQLGGGDFAVRGHGGLRASLRRPSHEHDQVAEGVRRQPDGSANVDGGVTIRDLNRVMDWNLPDEEATTIAGLVIHEARLIPEPGQSFTFHGFRFQVLRRTRNRITALRITPLTRKVIARVS